VESVKNWVSNGDAVDVVLLPGTGEHGFLHRRTSVAIPLAKQGIATLVRWRLDVNGVVA
jgi:hypothetical protein